MSFSDKILYWFQDFGRSLPWRGINDPYKIWLSEIILQQTRIDQGMDYYLHFIEHYPTVQKLAEATEEQVLKSWQGLGYYSRARNLHASARYIAYDLDGRFPSSYPEILKLRGVGKYTAAAIASFAFKEPYPVIDGNVYRFISRLYGISTPVPSEAAYKEFESLLSKLIDPQQPDRFNHAIMDFGSTYCKPLSPNCAHCVFKEECVAYKEGRVELLPVKASGAKVKDRWFYYFHVEYPNTEGTSSTLCHRRTGNDIWKGLYEFPLAETPVEQDPVMIDGLVASFLQSLNINEPYGYSLGLTLKHQLTHRTIHATFLHIRLTTPITVRSDREMTVTYDELSQLPVSKLIERYLALQATHRQ